MKRILPRFNPTYKGRPLFHESLDPPPGLLHFDASYELLRAARWRGYPWGQFDSLDSDTQALIVAEYRIEMRYQAVDAWEHRPKADGTSRSPTRRRRRR